MDISNVEDKVIGITAAQLEAQISSVSGKSHFITDLDADSLDCVELLMSFEEEFDVHIALEDAENCETVSCAVDLIHQNLQQG